MPEHIFFQVKDGHRRVQESKQAGPAMSRIRFPMNLCSQHLGMVWFCSRKLASWPIMVMHKG